MNTEGECARQRGQQVQSPGAAGGRKASTVEAWRVAGRG